MTDLKPCPFCGCTSITTNEFLDGFGKLVRSVSKCDRCGASGPVYDPFMGGDLDWNSRVNGLPMEDDDGYVPKHEKRRSEAVFEKSDKPFCEEHLILGKEGHERH